jgi:hypothetical protein
MISITWRPDTSKQLITDITTKRFQLIHNTTDMDLSQERHNTSLAIPADPQYEPAEHSYNITNQQQAVIIPENQGHFQQEGHGFIPGTPRHNRRSTKFTRS